VGSGGLCAVTAVGLALTLVLIALVDSGPTAWSAGAGGVAAMGSSVLLVRRERTALRPMTYLGRILGLLGAGVLFPRHAPDHFGDGPSIDSQMRSIYLG